MCWSYERLIATKNLIDVLLQKDHPGIFDRYGKKLTEVEAGQLKFISNLLGFAITPNEELFEKLIGYKLESDDEDYNEAFDLIQNIGDNPDRVLYWMGEHKRLGNKSFLTDMHFITGIKRTAQFLEYYRRFLIKNKDKLDKSAYTGGINICKNLLHVFRVEEDIKNINVDNIKKNFPYYLDKLATNAVKAKKYNHAIELYKKILYIYPFDYRAIRDMGFTYENMDMFDAAKKEYEKLAEFWPNDISPYIYLGRLFYNQEKYGEALEFYQKAKKIDKDDFFLWFDLGLLYSRMGDYQKAAAANKKAIEIRPNESTSWNNLGWVQFQEGSYGNALKNFRKAIELNKKDLMAHFNIAETLMAMQNYDDSYSYYKYIFDALKPDKKFVKSIIKTDITRYFIDKEKPVIFAYFIRGFLFFKIREYEMAKNDLTTFLTRFKGEKKWISISRKLLGKQ
jgi:tetratricopeptide (TPR) repeat protein